VQVEAAIQEATAGLQQGVASITAQLSDTLANEAQLTTRLDRWTGAQHMHGPLIGCADTHTADARAGMHECGCHHQGAQLRAGH
jgi:hypothetical protein